MTGRQALLPVVWCCLTGCIHIATKEQAPNGFLGLACNSQAAWRRTELFFGLSKARGPGISPADWQLFLEKVITPLFPEGLTVLESQGQWRSPQGRTVNEPGRVLVLIYPAQQEHRKHGAIESISSSYKERFGQDSVLRVDDCVAAAF
mgnify:CR=1 FL=1